MSAASYEPQAASLVVRSYFEVSSGTTKVFQIKKKQLSGQFFETGLIGLDIGTLAV